MSTIGPDHIPTVIETILMLSQIGGCCLIIRAWLTYGFYAILNIPEFAVPYLTKKSALLLRKKILRCASPEIISTLSLHR
jgi:hypothetical protein